MAFSEPTMIAVQLSLSPMPTVAEVLLYFLVSQLAVNEVCAYRVPRVGKDQNVQQSSRLKGHRKAHHHRQAVPTYTYHGPIALDLLVVVDPSSYGYHGADTEHYVMEMMNVAAGLWRSTSLNVNVTLRVVRVEILKKNRDDLQITDANSMILLRNFCQWQFSYFARFDEDSAFVYDAAILITRIDIHIGGNYLASGLAYNRGVCDPSSRCAVCEDESPMSLAHTIAHEIGHLLGMRHDGDGNSCPDRVNIMSGYVTHGANTFLWSQCSQQALLSFINSPPATCSALNRLVDVDGKRGVALDSEATPGHFYDADYQCQMQFGPESGACSDWNGSRRCHELKCVVQLWYASDCKSYKRPALQGTSCGPLKWCVMGSCVQRGSVRNILRPTPADDLHCSDCNTFPYIDTPAPTTTIPK